MSQRRWTPRDDEVEEEEEEEEVQQYQSQKDAILFAIHVSESMLAAHQEPDEPDEPSLDDPERKDKKKPKTPSTSAVLTALTCAYSILQSRIISSPSDLIGILLYNTSTTKFTDSSGSGSGYQHCHLLLDLNIPDAAGIRSLKAIVSDPSEFVDVLTPAERPVSLANILFAANQIFTTKAANVQSRRLFIVTDEDDPHAGDKALRNSAITRARDLYDLGVRIEPFFIARPSKPGGFNAAKFWDDVVYRAPGDDEEGETIVSATDDGTVRLKEMVSSILSRSTAKRALFSTKLELGPGLVVGVKGYMMYKRQKKARSHYVYTASERAQLVTGATTRITAETARIIEKAEIRKAYKFGGEQVVFTQEEMKGMRHLGDPVIRVLGFKPVASLAFEHNVKPATFIYPDEATYVGSTRTFAALHKKMVASGKIGIAWTLTRSGGQPSVCALYPSVEVLTDGVQTHPPGLFLIPLPFADDLRQDPDMGAVPKAPPVLIDKMRAVVKQLHMPKGYVPEKYSNPALQWHYRILQAIALDEDLPAQAADGTLPKYRLIEKYTGEQCREWFEELTAATKGMGVVATKVAGTKRSVVGVREGGGSAKRVKGEEGVVGDEVEAAWKGDKLDKMTVAKLKTWLESKGLSTAGKKADLMEAVENHFESK